MRSSMADLPLSLVRIITNAAEVHSKTPVVTYSSSGVHHSTFGSIVLRANALAFALRDELLVNTDTRVGTLMANSAEHMEIFIATSCMGTLFHPLNARLDSEHISFILDHAGDEIIFIDADILVDYINIFLAAPQLKHVVIVPHSDHNLTTLEHGMGLLRTKINVHFYEDILNNRETEYPWPVVPENTAAALCYTPATQGIPKGVTYSHRSLWLHSLNLSTSNAFALSKQKTFLCLTSLSHTLGWGVPVAALLMGTPLIFNGGLDTGARVARIIDEMHPDQACGTPDIWLDVYTYFLSHPDEHDRLFAAHLPQEIFAGGSLIPPALRRAWREHLDIELIQVWGMTETSPIGTVNREPYESENARYSGDISSAEHQGFFPAGLEHRVVDGSGNIIEDSQLRAGELQVRGNWVARNYYHPLPHRLPIYYRGQAVTLLYSHFSTDGWLATGDIATVSQQGELTIQDRVGDVIRTGQESIFSSQLEKIIISTPTVLDAAVIGMTDQQWGSRPLVIVQLLPDVEPSRDTALSIMRDTSSLVPDWMVPHHWTFVKKIAKTATGNRNKQLLRSQFDNNHFEIISFE